MFQLNTIQRITETRRKLGSTPHQKMFQLNTIQRITETIRANLRRGVYVRFQLNTIQRITETQQPPGQQLQLPVSIKHYPTNN